MFFTECCRSCMRVVKTTQNCVDYVLPKLFPCINIIFELLQEGCFGVVFRCALLVATIILIGRKILFIYLNIIVLFFI